jgi:hypothetical protein
VKRAALAVALACAPAAADADAGSGAAAPVDVTALPELAVAPAKPAFELFAVDAPVDEVVRTIAPPGRPYLAKSTAATLTGHLAARSASDAFTAIFAHEGTKVVTTGLTGGAGEHVDLELWQASQRSVFEVLSETARVNIILPPGNLGGLDVWGKHLSPAKLTDAIAAFDGRHVVRLRDTWYILDKDVALPALPKLGNRRVRLLVRDATPADAFAALRAVTGDTVGACDGAPLRLAFHGDASEAARAILVTGNATLSTASCRLEETAALDPATDHLVALATSERLAVAVITRGPKHLLVRQDMTANPPRVIGDTYLMHGDHSIEFARPGPMPMPLPIAASELIKVMKRTIAVVRDRKAWTALVTAGVDDEVVIVEPSAGRWHDHVPTVSERGVQFAASPEGKHDARFVPLAH